jgi:hypothetical protein
MPRSLYSELKLLKALEELEEAVGIEFSTHVVAQIAVVAAVASYLTATAGDVAVAALIAAVLLAIPALYVLL